MESQSWEGVTLPAAGGHYRPTTSIQLLMRFYSEEYKKKQASGSHIYEIASWEKNCIPIVDSHLQSRLGLSMFDFHHKNIESKNKGDTIGQ